MNYNDPWLYPDNDSSSTPESQEKELHELTDEDRRAIYECAMERSRQIISGAAASDPWLYLWNRIRWEK